MDRESRPILHAESACPLHLAVAPLVVVQHATITPIPQAKISAKGQDLTTSFQLQLESPIVWFPDLFDALNPAPVSIVPQHCWLETHSQFGVNVYGWKKSRGISAVDFYGEATKKPTTPPILSV
jgi:hypothetical protein